MDSLHCGAQRDCHLDLWIVVWKESGTPVDPPGDDRVTSVLDETAENVAVVSGSVLRYDDVEHEGAPTHIDGFHRSQAFSLQYKGDGVELPELDGSEEAVQRDPDVTSHN